MGPVDVSLALALFHERHPGVELTVREQSSEELAEMLRDDVLDLAFLSVTERIESHGLSPPSARLRGAGGGSPGRPPARRSAAATDGRARRRAVRQLPGGRPVARAADVRGPPRGVRAADQARVERERADQAARGPRHGCRDPPALGRRPVRGQRRRRDAVQPSLRRDITLACREGRRLPPAAAEFLQLSKELFANEPAGGDAPTAAPSRSDRRASTAGPRPPAGRRAER